MIGFLGIDGGGTKTNLLMIDEEGNIHAKITGPSTNPSSCGGVEQSLTRLFALMEQLSHQVSHHQFDMIYMFSGISGMSNYGLQGIPVLQSFFPHSIIGWDIDGISALYSGTLGKAGGVFIAGTGSVAYGLTPRGKRIQVGGWGHWLGDEGSGFSMGRLALRRVMEEWEKRRSPTFLTKEVLKNWSLKNPSEIIPYLTENGGKEEIAALAPFVFKAAKEGDMVSIGILEETGAEQGRIIRTLVNRLAEEIWEGAIPIVLSGGLFHQSGWFLKEIRKELASGDHKVEIILPQLPPVAGAVVSAMKLAMIPQDEITQRMKRLHIQLE